MQNERRNSEVRFILLELRCEFREGCNTRRECHEASERQESEQKRVRRKIGGVASDNSRAARAEHGRHGVGIEEQRKSGTKSQRRVGRILSKSPWAWRRQQKFFRRDCGKQVSIATELVRNDNH